VFLGEALADRASKRKQLEQVAARAAAVARYQEGEEPAENADELLVKGRALIGELREPARRINRTNCATELEPGFTLTDALALRDGYAAQYKPSAMDREAAEARPPTRNRPGPARGWGAGPPRSAGS